MVSSIGIIPVYGTKPYVGFKPTIPHQLAGIRMEPPWSPPIATSTTFLATFMEESLETRMYHYDINPQT
jgi:hypothetical protein